MKTLVWVARAASFGFFILGIIGFLAIILQAIGANYMKYKYISLDSNYVSAGMIASFLLIYLGSLGIEASYNYLVKK